ncbi:hypothetical protein NUV26_21380 [Burkholderia pseudomultivorans]|uniref:hypothetical protein n=1 Tax=Burkholderia pseudomultivorans TaxID=1207504 RepID=UPI0001FD768C|nr:hypothetical protein [Burkholderia pseudomultivorans]EGD06426.1 hypothetical protein B1M_01418 [Burkholderia sp. TJI49]AOI91363.1 hypothetical protein WS57_21560 [Burkholderia pseudomultivorans]KVC17413.1 hypothetical protein WS55_24650 [Burkholderia pseudomultivorans]KVC40080.1 hypothetical protein WS56_34100 [Burkholderia pseudomultivorans]KVC47001.1 hypothetical protein WS58_00275 [Burkholderia pseudomultivorans]
MGRHAHTIEDVVLDVDTADALRSAVGAATMLGPDKARALLRLSDAQLGHLFKVGIAQVIDLAATVTFGIAAAATRDRTDPGRAKQASGSTARKAAALSEVERLVLPERQALVASGRLLPAAEIWTALGITRQALNKAVASGRIFTVDVGAAQFYPAFYLAGDIDRKTLGRVTQQLGDLPGWSKWQFFTTPKASLGKLTPLKALAQGKVEQVMRAAAAFAER